MRFVVEAKKEPALGGLRQSHLVLPSSSTDHSVEDCTAFVMYMKKPQRAAIAIGFTAKAIKSVLATMYNDAPLRKRNMANR